MTLRSLSHTLQAAGTNLIGSAFILNSLDARRPDGWRESVADHLHDVRLEIDRALSELNRADPSHASTRQVVARREMEVAE
jgi:hypothetical protein